MNLFCRVEPLMRTHTRVCALCMREWVCVCVRLCACACGHDTMHPRRDPPSRLCFSVMPADVCVCASVRVCSRARARMCVCMHTCKRAFVDKTNPWPAAQVFVPVRRSHTCTHTHATAAVRTLPPSTSARPSRENLRDMSRARTDMLTRMHSQTCMRAFRTIHTCRHARGERKREWLKKGETVRQMEDQR